MNKRYVRFGLPLLCAAAMLGCAVTQADIQALRADVAALERDRAQQRRDLAGRLERLDSRMSGPESEIRRELAQTLSANDNLRVELQALRGQVEELQFRSQRGAGMSGEVGDILADKTAELETRVYALEQRVDPRLSPSRPPAPATRPDTSALSSPAEAMTPAPARETSPPAAMAPERALPTTRPSMQRPSTRRSNVDERSGASASRLYERAKHEYDAKNYEVAAVLFKQFVRDYPNNPLAGNSQYWLGETFYAQRQYEAAIVAFDEVIQKYGDNAKAPAAILKQGYAFAALDDNRNARFFLEQVQRKFPGSEEAKQAENKLKTLKN